MASMLLSAALVTLALLQDPPVEKRIDDLGSDDPAVREAAQSTLIRLGRPALPPLRRALETATDEEVNARLRVILAEIDPWFADRLLATIPAGLKTNGRNEVAFAPGGRAVAYHAFPAGRVGPSCVMVGNTPGEEFDAIEPHITFSPDGKTLVYPARSGDKKYAVVNGRKSEAYDEIGAYFVFTPDGRHISYMANLGAKEQMMGPSEGGKWFVVLDGKKGPEFDGFWWPVFKPAGETLAYSAREGKKELVIVDGKKIAEFDGVNGLTYSLDGSHMAYAAESGGKWSVYVDATKGPEFDLVTGPHFSADGRVVAYGANEGGTKEGPGEFNGGRWCAIIDGKKFCEMEGPGAPYMSPDGKRVACRISMGGVFLGFWRIDGANWRMDIDGRRGETLEWVGWPVWSPSGDRCAYEVWEKSKDVQFVMTGDRKGEAFDWITTAIVFSADGKSLAYGASKDLKAFTVVNDKKTEEFDEVWAPEFSPDGKRIGFGALKGREFWWKVVEVP